MNKINILIVTGVIFTLSLFISSCGGPAPEKKGVSKKLDGIYEHARPSIFNNGLQVLFAGTKNGKSSIYSMNIDGKNVKQILTYPHNTVSPVFNKNEDRIAFIIDKSGDGRGIIATCSKDGKSFKRITRDQSSNDIYDRLPSFTPDGKYIIFQRSQKHAFIQEFWRVNLADLTEEKIMEEIAWHPTAPVVSPDSNYFLYGQMIKMTFEDNKKIFPYRIYKYDFAKKKLETLGILGRNSPCLSPDGKGIIYSGTDDAALFISDSKGKNSRSIFYSEYKCKSPSYSPDGRKVIFLHFKEKWSVRAAITTLHIITKTPEEITPEWAE
ncbi:MAG: TolB family protein [Planctomycetota bacterium]|jgi:Tol biopolymer transport system component